MAEGRATTRAPAGGPFHGAPSLLVGSQVGGCRDELERLCRFLALEAKATRLGAGELIFSQPGPSYASCLLTTGCDTCAQADRLEVPRGEVVYELSERVDLAANPSLVAAVEKCRVETPEQLLALRECGVEYGQGFFLGEPRPDPVPLSPHALVLLRNADHVLHR